MVWHTSAKLSPHPIARDIPYWLWIGHFIHLLSIFSLYTMLNRAQKSLFIYKWAFNYLAFKMIVLQLMGI